MNEEQEIQFVQGALAVLAMLGLYFVMENYFASRRMRHELDDLYSKASVRGRDIEARFSKLEVMKPLNPEVTQ